MYLSMDGKRASCNNISTAVFVRHHGSIVIKPLLREGRLPNVSYVGVSHKLLEISIEKVGVCKISGFHGGDYEEWCLLGCYAVWLLYEPEFRRDLAPPSSG
jgi:hypothetical protein